MCKDNYMRIIEYTWRGTVEANKPINFCSRNWNISSTQSSPIHIVYFWFKWLPIGVKRKPTESGVTHKLGLCKAHPFSYRRSNAVTTNHNLLLCEVRNKYSSSRKRKE